MSEELDQRRQTAATPAEPAAPPIPAAPVLLLLSDLLTGIAARGLTPAEQHAASRAVLDWYGATVAGASMEPAVILAAAVAPFAGNGAARLVPGGEHVDARTAALVNATASHVAELDDIYREGIYHPGSPTVAAALALAEHRDASGADLLQAVAVGYEAGARIAETVNPAHYRYWHTTGTVGTLGAAAAAAALLGLDASRMAHAMATAATMAAGLQQAFRSDSMSKPLHAGHAAEAGLLAALAAERGYTGALDVLEGSAGFGAAMSDSPGWQTAITAPGQGLAIERMTVKDHSCCGHTFAAVDAALELRGELDIRPGSIASIEVRTYTTATTVAGYRAPQTPFEARFSTAYCVSAALALGGVRLRAFSTEALKDPLVTELESRVTVVPDDDMERAFPGRRQAEVTIRTEDGNVHTRFRHTRKGDPDDPLTDTELQDKFTDLAEPALGPASGDLAAALSGLARVSRVRDLPLG